ncbi:MAG: DNA glycosylase AlkZ-like family protein [Actinomycetota bacterium]
MAPVRLPRAQILAFRRRMGALDERLPRGKRSLRQAAWLGLQDSVPRAALLSIHARVEGTKPSTWRDPSLVQLWGPRHSAYVVAAVDLPYFSLGLLPDDVRGRERAYELADRLRKHLGGNEMTYSRAGRELGGDPNRLRYAAPTGTVIIRWEGAGQPTVRSVPPPEIDPGEARLEVARRHLHVLGPSTPQAFARWAGIKPKGGATAFERLHASLVPVRTPAGDAWILASDEAAFREAEGSPARARLLPSGDAYLLAADRELLVADADRRRSLWPPSTVWPGGVMVGGELVGTWRRAHAAMTVQPWRRLSKSAREAVEEEAASLPLPGVDRAVTVRWSDLETP